MSNEPSWNTLIPVYNDLALIKERVYGPCGLDCTLPIAEAESADYGAAVFSINHLSVIYRVAKITPKKLGQFVTIWKRNSAGSTEPFSGSDDFDLVIINTRSGHLLGQFIFPKAVLLAKGIITGNNKEENGNTRVSSMG